MGDERVWTKSYGREIPDVDASLFETDSVSLLEKSVARFKNDAALVYMGVRVTFGEVDDYANRFARMLISHGFRKGDAVGIHMPNIPEYVVAWLGVLKAGCVSSGVSPLLSPTEMEHQLKDGRIKGLVTLDAFFVQRVVEMAPRLPDLKLVVAASVGGFLPKFKRVLGKLLKKIPTGELTSLEGKTVLPFAPILKDRRYAQGAPPVELGPDDEAYLMYTGGTTGLPKGAVLTHRNSVAEMIVAAEYLERGKVGGAVLSAFPMFHIAGLVFNSLAFSIGWTQLLLPDPRNVEMICDLLEKEKPFLIANVPSIYYMLLSNPRFKSIDHSTLEICISAAAPFPVDSQKILESVIGKGKLVELYGMTETTAIAVMNPLFGEKKLGTVGLPLPNTDLKLVDPTSREEVPPGVPGEVLIRSPMVMKGYYNNPEETRLAIDDGGYMHTGDVAFMDEEGYMTLVDRTKDMIIVSGYKVFSKRVEDLMADHPAVEIMALIGVPNPDRPGSEMVKAYVILARDYDFDGDEEALKADIIRYAKECLAPYEVPKHVEILKEMPLTSVGKLDKKALRSAIQ